mgnify:CR=1 FL=1
MYKALLIINVYSGSSTDDSTRYTIFSKEVQLPFAPCRGQEILAVGDRSTPIVKSSWDVDSSMFRVYLEDRFSEYYTADDRDYDDWLEHFSDLEWSEHGEHYID